MLGARTDRRRRHLLATSLAISAATHDPKAIEKIIEATVVDFEKSIAGHEAELPDGPWKPGHLQDPIDEDLERDLS